MEFSSADAPRPIRTEHSMAFSLSFVKHHQRDRVWLLYPPIVIFYKRLGVTEISALSPLSHMSWRHATEARALGLL